MGRSTTVDVFEAEVQVTFGHRLKHFVDGRVVVAACVHSVDLDEGWVGLNGGGEGLSGDRVSGGVSMVIKREMCISRIIRGWRLVR